MPPHVEQEKTAHKTHTTDVFAVGANLPEKRSGRRGQGLTSAKMKECHWLRPALVGQFEFVEWTADLHLRHTRFIALRDDKTATDVRRESA